MAQANYQLPAYERQQLSSRLKHLRDMIYAIRSKVAPRKGFAFSRGSKGANKPSESSTRVHAAAHLAEPDDGKIALAPGAVVSHQQFDTYTSLDAKLPQL